MPASKTNKSVPGVDAFLERVTDPSRKKDCIALIDIMKKATKSKPRMWGAAIVGFGDLHYRYESGREGDTFILGFASRKPDLTIYLGCALAIHEELLEGLGKFKVSKGCLYIRRLEDIDLTALRRLLSEAAAYNATTAAPRKSDG